MKVQKIALLSIILALALVNVPPYSMATAQSGELTVVFLDVGQGDATILLTPNGSSVLIDGGTRGQTSSIIDMAQQLGLQQFDVVVATHPDADHIGGLIGVLNTYPVGQVLDSGQMHTTQTFEDYIDAIDSNGIPFVVAREGDSIDLDPDVELQVLNPPASLPTGADDSDDFNDNSVVVKLTYDEFTALFTGDIEEATEARLTNMDIEVDILKAAHHGSAGSSNAPFLAAVSPEVVVVSAGANNQYGHPSEEALSRIEAVEPVEIFRTDTDGTITLVSDGQEHTIESVTGKTVVVPEFHAILLISILPLAAIIMVVRNGIWKSLKAA